MLTITLFLLIFFSISGQTWLFLLIFGSFKFQNQLWNYSRKVLSGCGLGWLKNSLRYSWKHVISFLCFYPLVGHYCERLKGGVQSAREKSGSAHYQNSFKNDLIGGFYLVSISGFFPGSKYLTYCPPKLVNFGHFQQKREKYTLFFDVPCAVWVMFLVLFWNLCLPPLL